MNKKRAKLILIFGIIVGVTFWLAMPDASPTLVGSNLPVQEIAKIKNAVHREMRREFFSTVSFGTIKHVPRHFMQYLQYKIVNIDVDRSDHVYVSLKRRFGWFDARYLECTVNIGTNGWEVSTVSPNPYN